MTQKYIKLEELLDLVDFIDYNQAMTSFQRAAEKLDIADTWVNRLKILTIEDYKAELPEEFKQICEIHYTQEETNVNEEVLYGYVKRIPGLDCELVCGKCDESDKQCGKCIDLTPFQRTQGRNIEPYYWWQRVKWSRAYDSLTCDPKSNDVGWKKMTANHVYLDQDKLCEKVNISCEESYRIEGCDIHTSFEKGKILLAYLGQKTVDGEIVVPDNPWVIDYLTEYATYRFLYTKYLSDMNPQHRQAYLEAKQFSDLSYKRAKTKISIPTPLEFDEFINNIWRKR